MCGTGVYVRDIPQFFYNFAFECKPFELLLFLHFDGWRLVNQLKCPSYWWSLHAPPTSSTTCPWCGPSLWWWRVLLSWLKRSLKESLFYAGLCVVLFLSSQLLPCCCLLLLCSLLLLNAHLSMMLPIATWGRWPLSWLNRLLKGYKCPSCWSQCAPPPHFPSPNTCPWYQPSSWDDEGGPCCSPVSCWRCCSLCAHPSPPLPTQHCTITVVAIALDSGGDHTLGSAGLQKYVRPCQFPWAPPPVHPSPPH